MPLPENVDRAVQEFDKILHKPGQVTNALAVVEEKTGVRRLYIAGSL